MGSHSKLKVGGDGEDKISQLPDGVLFHVLSFLPTKHAVRTSILSTRWKNIWASVHCLDLEHYYCDERRSRHADIQRFRLHYHCFSEDLSRIDGWIRTAIRRNVVELDLCVRLQGDNVEKIELPKTIFLCKTLVVLKLNLKSNCFIYAPPESGCFPNLKVLHIGVDCPDKEFMEKLFTFFPLLEDLTIDGYLSSAISGTFKLFVPELKRLSIEVDSNMSYEDPYEYYFSINAPKLEFLNLKVYLLPSIIFDNATSPVKAVVNFDHHDSIEHEHYWDSATTILAAISNVQHLSLSVHTFDASCIPDFDNLIHLKLVLHDCHHWEVLAELLHRTPNLERLVLEHNEDMYCKPDREVDSDKERYLADKANSEDKENSENEETSEDELNSEHFSKDVVKHNEDMYCKSDREVDSDKERYLADKANSEDKENSENEETSEDELYSEHFSKDVVKHNEDVYCNSDCEVSDEERYLADKADSEDTENSESEETSEDEEYSDHPYSEDEEIL
ncbi:PREDICTED: F-box/FBD/LRR-repeat protein At5g22660-like [Fragaria vesca subsp. vesca]